jgi:protein TonB
MNPGYSLAYSRAGSGEFLVSARRDRVIAVLASLAVYASATWISSLRTHPGLIRLPAARPVVLASTDPVVTEVKLDTADDPDPAVILPQPTPRPQQPVSPPAPIELTSRLPAETPGVPLDPSALGATSPFRVPGKGLYGPAWPVPAAAADRGPVTVFKAPPVYPISMRSQHLSGSAVVDFIVDRKGMVRDARTIFSTQRDFGTAAADAVSRWRFKPALKRGHPVDFHLQVPVVFTLDKP